ncbi:MAG: hypothetical protein ACR2OU_03975 [Thermomicrobiales bacterium]
MRDVPTAVAKAPDDLRVFEYHLLPPRLCDIHRAAEVELGNPQPFLEALNQARITSLLARPGNLMWVFRVFESEGHMPLNQAELFRRGIQITTADSRHPNRNDQDFAIASRIAFNMMLSNLSVATISLTAIHGNTLCLRDLQGAAETTAAGSLSVNFDELVKTVEGGLFNQVSDTEFIWGHQTYPEFLAGRYLAELPLPISQKIALLTNPSDRDQKIVPGLIEVAAWASAHDPSLFNTLIEIDPENLLRSDVALADPAARLRLASSFLNSLDEGSTVPTRWYTKSDLNSICVEGLPALLLNFILDPQRKPKTRDIAIDIASACESSEVANAIAEIATNEKLPEYLRSSAARLIQQLGDEIARVALKSLIDEKVPDDPFMNLRGYALMANWPERVTTQKFIESFTAPPAGMIGTYHHFLGHGFFADLNAADIIELLDWWTNQDVWSDAEYNARQYEQDLVSKAFLFFDDDALRSSLIKFFIVQKDKHRFLFIDQQLPETYINVMRDQEKRRQLISQYIQAIPHEDLFSQGRDAIHELYFGQNDLVKDDIDWFKQLVISSSSLPRKEFWVRVLQWSDMPELLDTLWELTNDLRSVGLHEELLGTIDWRSEAASKARYTYNLLYQRNSEKDDDPVMEMNNLVASYLDLAESTHTDWWWKVDEAILSEGNTYYNLSDGAPTTTLLPGWAKLSSPLQDRVFAAALRFITSSVPQLEVLGTNKYSHLNSAAVRAFGLIRDIKADKLDDLDNNIYQKWGPVLLTFNVKYEYQDTGYIEEILRRSIQYDFDPFAWIRDLALRETVNDSNDLHNALVNSRTFVNGEVVGPFICSIIDDQVSPYGLRPTFDVWRNMISPDLIRNSFASLTKREPSNKDIGILISALLPDISEDNWQAVYPYLIQHDHIFKVIFFDYDNHDRRHSGFSDRLSAASLADLYVRMVKVFPPIEDGREPGAHWVSPRERAGNLRDGILEQIIGLGRWDAVAELGRIAPGLPEITWMPRSIARAKEQARAATWSPPTVPQLMELVKSKDARIIRSDAQLFDVVLEELDRLEEKLHGESPMVRNLWNIFSKKMSGETQPKEETEVANSLHGLLREDLRKRSILYDCELENRPGNEIDAYFQLQDPETQEIYTVPCEIKCCYHTNVYMAMQDQLFKRYMQDQGHHFGIYLVPFFDCVSWQEENSSRRHHSKKHSLEQLRADLEAQANELSTNGYTVRPYVIDCRLEH